ncbi:glycosyltransferase [Zavarzinia compransoris]|uniref:glycosyltransferase n=1 Tax=Zavarzinia compransoris TaxID=1264899 RepID=UPI001061BF01|nr:glycosyltransferase [Zavarzinia compransoris]
MDLQGSQTESRFRGIGRQTRALAHAMIAASRGHDIHLLLNGALTDNLDELLTEFEPLVGLDHLHVFQAGTGVAERDPNNLWRTRAAELLREAFIAELRPDVVHIASLFEGFVDDAVTSIGAFDVPYKTAVTLHDLIPMADPARYLAEERHALYYWRRAQALKRADLLLSVSEYSRQEAHLLAQIPLDRISVISGGVEPKFRHAALSPAEEGALRGRYKLEKPFIFYVGAVDPRKNVELIFDAFARLPAALRASHDLAFAGRLFEEEKGHLRALAARFGVNAKSLVFCDHVPEDDLVRLYGLADLFVFPSKHEGFGLPALEAMACGAPVLASRATSLPEVVGRDDFLFDPLKAGELASLMEPALTDAELRAAMREWGLGRAATLTWARAGARALDAMEDLHARAQAEGRPAVPVRAALRRKPMMAFFSPLPGDHSGIADYSAELLRELARFYEIECIIVDTVLDDDWLKANVVMRDIGWFERNAHLYDRIVYSIGNSHFHQHMLGLIQRYPGIAILHDFFLSDLIDWLSNTGRIPSEEFYRELYRTHGLGALQAERREGRLVAVDRFACNSVVFRNATGVIVHSRYAIDRATEIYGEGIAGMMHEIPHLRALSHDLDRTAARARLGIGEDEFVVCSFGIMTRRKQSRKLLDAWIANYGAGKVPGRLRLVFVGENAAGDYGKDLVAEIARHKGRINVSITGFAPTATYRDYLAAADVAVQLRTGSRGETSGTILDCLAARLPVIINNHGTAAELPDDALVKLPDVFDIADLAREIERFRADAGLRAAQGQRAAAHILAHHHPADVGDAFHEAIETISLEGRGEGERILLRALADFNAPVYPNEFDFRSVANAITSNKGRVGPRQILYDVTVLAEQDAKTGIQRVVRSILARLIESPPPGYVVEPVQIEDHFFRYARVFADKAYNVPAAVLPNAPVEFDKGDIYLAIDWVPDRLPQAEGWLRRFRQAGGKVVIGVHDLLPMQMPQFFPPNMDDQMRRWLEVCLRTADQFLCVSRVVADDVVRYAEALGAGDRHADIEVGYFHNGSDLEASLPTKGLVDGAEKILKALKARRTFLLVGTVEPRKGHQQVLDALDVLWQQGADVGLAIVGKIGWMTTGIAERLNSHPELGKRLFWFQGISDEMLDLVYDASAALVAASAGEGFGLPLIEAARRETPLIVRDIPVFREVAGAHAFYFKAENGQDLAAELQRWLDLAADLVPPSKGMPFLTWSEATDQVIDAVFGRRPYRTVQLRPKA